MAEVLTVKWSGVMAVVVDGLPGKELTLRRKSGRHEVIGPR